MAEVSKTTGQLIALLRERDRAGLAKYGTTLDRTDLTGAEWTQHAVEELLDAAGYLLARRRTENQSSPGGAAMDAKALAVATEIASMQGQDRSQFVSRIQVAVREAMDWMVAGGAAPQQASSPDYSDCCDSPAYCSSVRRCTAKDAPPIAPVGVVDGAMRKALVNLVHAGKRFRNTVVETRGVLGMDEHGLAISAAEAALAQQPAAVDGATRRDAERYRWLRLNANEAWEAETVLQVVQAGGRSLDSRIDEDMAGQQQGGTPG